MSDLPDPVARQPDPPRKTSRLAWAVVVLMLVLVLVDVFAIQFLGQPAAPTCENVGPVPRDTTGR
ncbi:unnamed protein product [Gemmataceae bacterium]|nr:unnamed protein product [Gemmataceae bacterium]VTT97601.1 unnamed protein product [Gemmataceae bacterium]